RDTKIPQFGGPPIKVGDEVIHKELGDRMERAATTASSLEVEQDSGSGLRCQDTILGDVNAQTRFEITSIQSIDLPLSRGYTLGSGEDSMKLIGIDEIIPKFAETYNVVAFLEKPEESDGFVDIIDFLKASFVSYALTVNPVIYTSCIEQFWATAKVQTVNGVRQIQALVDKKRVIVTESSIRRDLHLDDAEGTDCLPTATIFEELARMGYEKPSQKLTFYKAFFSPQWKYFIHTITQCLSAKSTAWNEFSSSMASLIICLATNQKFNLSKYIFDAMVKHLDGGVKFLLYPRFLQVFINQQLGNMSTHKKIFVNPFHTKKVFANMKRAGKDFSRRITPLFDTMMVQPVEEMGEDSDNPTDSTPIPIIDQPSSSSQPKKEQVTHLAISTLTPNLWISVLSIGAIYSGGQPEEAIQQTPRDATLADKLTKKNRVATKNLFRPSKHKHGNNTAFYNKPFTFVETEKDIRDLVASPFTDRIRDYDMPDGLKVPTNLKTYDGTFDPDDHLTIFMGTMDVHKLPEPAWCRFFHITLCGAARFWSVHQRIAPKKALQGPDCSTTEIHERFIHIGT
ncbi:hypothetical protein Tco_1130371, partial [Tanacetum coccineum]